MRGAFSGFSFAVAVLAGAFCLSLSYPAAPARADDKATTLELAGLNLYEKGDLAGAIEKYREALALKPDNRAFRENLAQALNDAGVNQYNNKDFAGAIVTLREAVSLAPSFKQAKDNLGAAQAAQLNSEGTALYKAGNFQGAADKFSQALAAEPTNIFAKVNYDLSEAEILTNNKDFAGAVAKLQEADSLAPPAQKSMIETRLATAKAALEEAQKKAAEEAAKQEKAKP